MKTDSADEEISNADTDNGLSPLQFFLVMLGGALFLDLLSLFNRGGFFSLLRSYHAIQEHALFVAIDSNGLFLPITTFCAVVVAGAYKTLGIALKDGQNSTIAIFIVIGAGFGLSLGYGPTLITKYMTTHGYSHCSPRDQHIGHGKGSVWLNDYVFHPLDCSKH